MSDHDVFLLKIFVLLLPPLVALTGLVGAWLSAWITRHDQRHHPAE